MIQEIAAHFGFSELVGLIMFAAALVYAIWLRVAVSEQRGL